MVTATKTATELLIDARDFIANHSRWCTGMMGTANGLSIYGPRLLEADRCCGQGSLQRSAWGHGMDLQAPNFLEAADLLDRSAILLHPECEGRMDLGEVAYVNDKLGHAAILRVYDAAIAASQEGGQ